MPLTLVATVGAADANAYGTLEQLAAYAGDSAVYASASEPRRVSAGVEAGRLLNALLYQGTTGY